jgi:hypothetical protein
MAANIIAFFDWRCPFPLVEVALPALEQALLDCAPLLEPMGLLGQVGTCDVWAMERPSGSGAVNVVLVHRLDIPEMKAILGPRSTAMDLSLLWGFYVASHRRAELSRFVLEMAGHFPVTEAFIAPHGLEESANQAFEKVCQGRDFAEVKESLLASRYAWGFKRDLSGGWTILGGG